MTTLLRRTVTGDTSLHGRSRPAATSTTTTTITTITTAVATITTIVLTLAAGGTLGGCSDDSASPDARPVDAGPRDLELPDGTRPDLRRGDTAARDTATRDTAAPDTAAPDMAAPDMAAPDMPPPDADPPDLALPDAPLPDQCVTACGGKVCGDPDGCGGTCKPGSGCASPPGSWTTIKAGTFQMGSPASEKCRDTDETLHQVTLTRKVAIMRAEVTQAQFQALVGYNPSTFAACGATCPVETVSWEEAAAYANALSAQMGKVACYACKGSGKAVSCGEAPAYAGSQVYACPGFRLPTEAEWEAAYRAGTSTAYFNGGNMVCKGQDPNLGTIGWYWENSHVSYAGSSQGRGTHPGQGKAQNAYGLYDMAGNVREWCHDLYGSYPSSAVTDPVGTSGKNRVRRGGGWNGYAEDCRAAERNWFPADYRYFDLGFRLVRTVP